MEKIMLRLQEGQLKISPIVFNEKLFFFEPFVLSDVDNEDLIRSLKKWREKYAWVYPSVFNVTFEGTKNWLVNLVINNPQRVLFKIIVNNIFFGHIGYLLGDEDGTVELDNILRGKDSYKGIMTQVVSHFTSWAYRLGFKKVILRVFGDNIKAVRLYYRCNFKVQQAVPMKLELTNNGYKWVPQKMFDKLSTFRVFLVMEHKKD